MITRFEGVKPAKSRCTSAQDRYVPANAQHKAMVMMDAYIL
jgi:hypothetical protein